MAFTRSWSIISPADTDYAKYGARDIRYFRVDIQERVGVEHSFAGDASDGVHNQGSARIYRQSSAPTDTLAGRVWFDTTNDLFKIADGASYITPTWASGNIKDSAVTTTKIASLAVTNAKIADLAVSTGKIQDLAVTEAKIATGAVTVNKLGTGAVTNAKLGASAVTTDKIQDGTIALGDLNSSLQNQIALRGCSAYRTSSYQSVTGTTALQWNAENFDTSSMHDNSTNPSRIVIPSGYSYAKISAHFPLDYSLNILDTLAFYAFIRRGGSEQVTAANYYSFYNSDALNPLAGNMSVVIAPRILAVSSGNYFEVVVVVTDSSGYLRFPNTAYGYFQVELIVS